MKKILFICLFFVFSMVIAKTPEVFLFLGGDSSWVIGHQKLLANNKNIIGVQIVYNWKKLEPKKGVYDFSEIESDLQLLNKLNKKLVVQIQDRSFRPQDKWVPTYMLIEKQYDGGVAKQVDNPGESLALASGWVAMQWNKSVRKDFQAMLGALAKQFDGKVYAVNLPETSIDLSAKIPPSGYTCDNYFNATIENIMFLRNIFKNSYVIQYVNFFPCEWDNDHDYMGRLFKLAMRNNIGLGNPDTVPYKKAQMKNSYQFFNKYKGKLPLVAIAIQEPDYTYTNPQTKNKFTTHELASFAQSYLGANIVFWNVEEPIFSKLMLPQIENNNIFSVK